MKPEDLKRVYFLGIGGIGMSAIARYFLSLGIEIFGYDLTRNVLTRKLEDEGMHIHYDIDPGKIPDGVDLVVRTPAIPQDHAEWQWFRENGYRIMKRAEVLGALSQRMRTIAIAGTHGKTSTSSLLTHMLKYCGLDVTAFVGGIVSGYNTNYFRGDSDWLVVEADEYDRSFLHLSPEILVITSLDADHLDIYGKVGDMYEAYEILARQIRPGGTLILGCDVEGKFSEKWTSLLRERNIAVYRAGRDFAYANIRVDNEKFHFDFKWNAGTITAVSGMAGEHNISNASMAMQVALGLGAGIHCLVEAVALFKGIQRRFEKLYDESAVLIDDYAHHPEEIRFAVDTVRRLYPKRHVLGIFQPHLYSRTRDFYREFAESLGGLDEVWLLPVYPAREKPIEGVSTEMIYNLIRNDNKVLIEAEALIKRFEAKEYHDVVITLGASDLDKYHSELIEVLKKKH